MSLVYDLGLKTKNIGRFSSFNFMLNLYGQKLRLVMLRGSSIETISRKASYMQAPTITVSAYFLLPITNQCS